MVAQLILILITSRWPCDTINNGWWDFEKCHYSPSDNHASWHSQTPITPWYIIFTGWWPTPVAGINVWYPWPSNLPTMEFSNQHCEYPMKISNISLLISKQVYFNLTWCYRHWCFYRQTSHLFGKENKTKKKEFAAHASITAMETLPWCHTERDGVSNHQRLDCLLNHLFRRRSKKTSKLYVTGLCEGNPPVTDVFPSQRATNVANVSISWRRHEIIIQKFCEDDPFILCELQMGMGQYRFMGKAFLSDLIQTVILVLGNNLQYNLNQYTNQHTNVFSKK